MSDKKQPFNYLMGGLIPLNRMAVIIEDGTQVLVFEFPEDDQSRD